MHTSADSHSYCVHLSGRSLGSVAFKTSYCFDQSSRVQVRTNSTDVTKVIHYFLLTSREQCEKHCNQCLRLWAGADTVHSIIHLRHKHVDHLTNWPPASNTQIISNLFAYHLCCMCPPSYAADEWKFHINSFNVQITERVTAGHHVCSLTTRQYQGITALL